MDSWDEIRTAYQVARAGTVSGAAEVLGVHHATVIRHIDALEGRLGVKLFQRHPRGYTPTEAGQDLLRVAQATDEQFGQLRGRIKGLGEGVRGDLVVTSLGSLAPLIVPVIAEYQRAYPEVTVRYLTGERLFRLEYGEAHVAIRAGGKPTQPDNVVQPFLRQDISLVASRDYIARHGAPEGVESLTAHRFIGSDDDAHRAPFQRWLMENVGPGRIVFRAEDFRIARDAIRAGIGLGFLPTLELKGEEDLVEVLPPDPSWSAQLWLVTHVDLHRTAKVQSFLDHLKASAAAWPV